MRGSEYLKCESRLSSPVATVPVHIWRGTEETVGTDIETSIDGILRNLGSRHRLSRSGYIKRLRSDLDALDFSTIIGLFVWHKSKRVPLNSYLTL